LSGFLLWERFELKDSWPHYLRRQAALVAPLGVTWIALSGYFIATVGWRQLWFFLITYPSHFALMNYGLAGLGLSHTLSWAVLPDLFQAAVSCLLIPAIYLACLWLCLFRDRTQPFDTRARIVLIAVVGVTMYFEVAQSPTWFRFYNVSAPAVILLGWLLDRSVRWRVFATSLLFAVVVSMAAHQTISRHIQARTIAELPGGRVAMTAAQAEKPTWIAARTHPGEFVYHASWPALYLQLAVRSPAFLDNVLTDVGNRLGYLDQTVRELQARRVKYIFWTRDLNSRLAELAVFYQFLQADYQRVWVFSDQEEVWELKTQR
jgi:hypothetical protein